MLHSQSFVSRFIPDVRFQQSMFWGVVTVLGFLVASKFLFPLHATLREWGVEFFSLFGVERFFYPGFEIPFTFALIYLVGRMTIRVKGFFKRFMNLRGAPVIYEQQGKFAPGLAQGAMPVEGFPYPYLVKVMTSIRGIPDFVFLPPENVRVVTGMTFEKFMLFYTSGGGAAPSACKTIPWEQWTAESQPTR